MAVRRAGGPVAEVQFLSPRLFDKIWRFIIYYFLILSIYGIIISNPQVNNPSPPTPLPPKGGRGELRKIFLLILKSATTTEKGGAGENSQEIPFKIILK